MRGLLRGPVFAIINTMVVRMRSTRSHTGNRRSHHALRQTATILCPKCGESKLPQRVCFNCGTYKGREVIDVLKKLTKKDKKKKEKELAGQEAERTENKQLDAAELSKQ